MTTGMFMKPFFDDRRYLEAGNRKGVL